MSPSHCHSDTALHEASHPFTELPLLKLLTWVEPITAWVPRVCYCWHHVGVFFSLPCVLHLHMQRACLSIGRVADLTFNSHGRNERITQFGSCGGIATMWCFTILTFTRNFFGGYSISIENIFVPHWGNPGRIHPDPGFLIYYLSIPTVSLS